MPLKRWKSLYEKYHRKYNIYVNIGVYFFMLSNQGVLLNRSRVKVASRSCQIYQWRFIPTQLKSELEWNAKFQYFLNKLVRKFQTEIQINFPSKWIFLFSNKKFLKFDFLILRIVNNTKMLASKLLKPLVPFCDLFSQMDIFLGLINMILRKSSK